ncbi:hypothetical protein PAXRUDRAFT_181977, partial [Paxillus rubicundulus Ve08.2h10]
DGHDSHETNSIKRAAYHHNIIIVALPSKTTHKLQLLDVGVFSSVARKWSSHCDTQLAQDVKISCYNFIQEYLSIHHVMTPQLVWKAFKHTGIHPLNPNIFSE